MQQSGKKTMDDSPPPNDLDTLIHDDLVRMDDVGWRSLIVAHQVIPLLLQWADTRRPTAAMKNFPSSYSLLFKYEKSINDKCKVLNKWTTWNYLAIDEKIEPIKKVCSAVTDEGWMYNFKLNLYKQSIIVSMRCGTFCVLCFLLVRLFQLRDWYGGTMVSSNLPLWNNWQFIFLVNRNS